MQIPPSHQTQVLIVGGSLVGLSAALFLAYRGVDTIVVEKHRGSSKHPRAIGFTELTLEHYRAVGIADHIPQAPPGVRLRRARVDSLVGTWHEETDWTPYQKEVDKGVISPCTGAAIAQDKLEPILREGLTVFATILQQGVEMVAFEQDETGITAQVQPRDGGDVYTIRAHYMIAADGADSPVREALGIGRTGIGLLCTIRSVLFNCAEAEPYLEKGIQQFEIEQPDFTAFLTHYPDGRWVLMFSDDKKRSEEDLKAAITRALGRNMAFDIITTGRWEMAGRIADRYSQGRVFLAGDAAHQLPPTRGGFGVNTGIDDVYNLAWKLDLVLKGEAARALLDTYNDERQPIGWLRHQQTFARPDYARWAGDALKDEPIYGAAAMEFGQRVASTAVVGQDAGLPPAADPDVWAGQPGTRVSHVWIDRAGEQVSTIDLFTANLTLVSANPRWIEAANAVAAELGIVFDTITIDTDVIFPTEQSFAATFGIGKKGAALVRPDAMVAWRTQDSLADPAAALRDVVSRTLGKTA